VIIEFYGKAYQQDIVNGGILLLNERIKKLNEREKNT
jgi:hypothetical protein